MSWILLTNDDGVDSPALVPFARALNRLGEVRVVVPDSEQSWKGKSITRHDPLRVEVVDREGVAIHACSGTPADSVQVAIHAIFDDPPDIVVSGINTGFNHGAGFLMSSGTVGAAFEGWVSGIDGFAFSTGSMRVPWDEWRRRAHDPSAQQRWDELSEVAVDLLSGARDVGLQQYCDVVSVNLPWEADEQTPRRVTSIARVGYDQLFRGEGDGHYSHDFGGGLRHFGEVDGTDVDATTRNWISITPVRAPTAAVVPSDVRDRLERG